MIAYLYRKQQSPFSYFPKDCYYCTLFESIFLMSSQKYDSVTKKACICLILNPFLLALLLLVTGLTTKTKYDLFLGTQWIN